MSSDADKAAAVAADAELSLPEEPTLQFRELHRELRAFAGQTMDDDAVPRFMTALLAAAPALRSREVFAAPSPSERAALQANRATVAGKSVDVSPLIQQEIVKLSDEFRARESACFAAWFLASDAKLRGGLERADQLAPGDVTSSIPAAARHILVSEAEFRLQLLKDLMRVRFNDEVAVAMDRKRRQFLVTFTNQLLTDGLIDALADLLETQLPALPATSTLEQAAGYWHCLVADVLALVASSARVLPSEVARLARLLRALCSRLHAAVARVSPHIVNLSSLAQLLAEHQQRQHDNSSLSPQGAVKQVSCLLRAIATLQVTLSAVLLQVCLGIF